MKFAEYLSSALKKFTFDSLKTGHNVEIYMNDKFIVYKFKNFLIDGVKFRSQKEIFKVKNITHTQELFDMSKSCNAIFVNDKGIEFVAVLNAQGYWTDFAGHHLEMTILEKDK